jgi:anti-sigma28 factor (negative regulator of flagellin synthesis)
VVAPFESDWVSTSEVTRAADVARAAQAKAGFLRSVRLGEVETAIRAGTYQPSSNRVASRLLDAAEIDAQLKSGLRH